LQLELLIRLNLLELLLANMIDHLALLELFLAVKFKSVFKACQFLLLII
jgi:hypothetical protein